VTSFPAGKRADQIASRIRDLAADPGVSPDSIAVSELEQGSHIVAGKQRILIVTDADARVEQLERTHLAGVYVEVIRKAIESYRSERTAEHLTRIGLYALAATVILVGFLWAGIAAMRRLDRTLDRRVGMKLEGIEAKSKRLVNAAQIRIALRGLRNFILLAVILIAVLLYLDYVLQLFPWTRYIGVQLLAMLLNPLSVMGHNVLASIPDLAFLAVLVFVTHYILKAIHLFFVGIERGTVTLASFEREWAMPTYRLIRLLIIAFAVVVAFPYIPGSGSDAFKGVSLFLGVMFSLGSTSMISNLVAGYSLIYRRAFLIGDRVRIGDDFGEVVHSRLLVTHLRTPKNELVVIPNSSILNSNVTNYSAMAREGQLILHTTVGIGYETPWRQVEAMLLQAAERTEGIVREPAPFVLQKSLGDFCVVYEINVYCSDASEMPRLYTSLHRNILDVFNEYGVQIMTPAYEGDPEQPKIVPKDQWYAAPARMTPATGK
jgi:small-conductance mechanosensitive channel